MVISSQTPLATRIQARSLLWWSRRQLAAVESLLEEARRTWSEAWIDHHQHDYPSLPPVRCQPAHLQQEQAKQEARGVKMPAWHLLCSRHDKDIDTQIWLDTHHADGRMAQLLLTSAAPATTLRAKSSVAADLGAAAMSGCITEILSALQVQPDEIASAAGSRLLPSAIPSVHLRPWSGAVHTLFPLSSGWSLHLHIAPQRMAALMKEVPGITTKGTPGGNATQPLEALHEALADRPMRLRVELGPVEISIGDLQTLSAGDVLIVPHPLAHPLQVTTAQHQILCNAHLGQLHGQRAIELIKSEALVDDANQTIR